MMMPMFARSKRIPSDRSRRNPRGRRDARVLVRSWIHHQMCCYPVKKHASAVLHRHLGRIAITILKKRSYQSSLLVCGPSVVSPDTRILSEGDKRDSKSDGPKDEGCYQPPLVQAEATLLRSQRLGLGRGESIPPMTTLLRGGDGFVRWCGLVLTVESHQGGGWEEFWEVLEKGCLRGPAPYQARLLVFDMVGRHGDLGLGWSRLPGEHDRFA
ncbi:hypothetical protein F4778DRAFT_412320 [Xylariomycetidae sp. FL2044]|nr:hypothetical protein F4778DRAFT_412320 [Xylariomycetidae sp. FL2044]